MPPSANIAQHLPRMAALQPDRVALKVPRGRLADDSIDYLSLSFAELDGEVNAWAKRLHQAGLQPGDRTLVMVRQGLPLIAVVFALFKLGAVPVVIDPGMGLQSFLRCVRHTEPRALVGIPVARLLSRLFVPTFRSVQLRVAVPSNPLKRLGGGAATFPTIERQPGDLAALLFTSGSTGAPKGVCYQHGQFLAQVEMIRQAYDIRPGEIDFPMLPIFALFNPALGMTTVVPEMDPSRPAQADPARLVQALRQEGVTNSFGSPTLWGRIIAYCAERNISLPTMRRVLCAGAPVPDALWEQSQQVLTQGILHSPYGATECLPVSTLSAAERPALVPGDGACVGRPLPGVEVRILPPRNGPLTADALAQALPAGERGEIVVSSPTVTESYFRAEGPTRLAKVTCDNRCWHRMGDIGYLDAEGRLWFCGRNVERVTTPAAVLDTEPVEQVFRGAAGVVRCALIGLGEAGRQIPALVVEAPGELDAGAWRALATALRERGRAHAHTRDIARFYLRDQFPVDVRHNAKIHRLSLARWAVNQKALHLP